MVGATESQAQACLIGLSGARGSLLLERRGSLPTHRLLPGSLLPGSTEDTAKGIVMQVGLSGVVLVPELNLGISAWVAFVSSTK